MSKEDQLIELSRPGNMVASDESMKNCGKSK